MPCKVFCNCTRLLINSILAYTKRVAYCFVTCTSQLKTCDNIGFGFGFGSHVGCRHLRYIYEVHPYFMAMQWHLSG